MKEAPAILSSKTDKWQVFLVGLSALIGTDTIKSRLCFRFIINGTWGDGAC